ncbi:MAG: alpha-hydroxy-acid oxidizing protein [Bryobacterales bacterium]|nr:alpha-hydroxy-acid oxidizing protein [Bryobacterales bacterium]
MLSRRSAFRSLAALAAGSPLFSQTEDVNTPVNVHEFEEIAKRKLHKLAYDFIASGAEDERTLRANREAFDRVFLLPRVMIDVSEIDTSSTFLGIRHEFPIFVAPTGGKNLVIPNADETVAAAALNKKIAICTATGTQKLIEEGKPVVWWTNLIGTPDKRSAETYARRVEDQGAQAIVLTVDNPYQSNRDRNNHNRFDYAYMQTGVPKPGEPIPPPRIPATAAMHKPHNPNLTWQWIGWAKGASKLPIIVKGILNPLDAALAVQNGADAISVSNHGGRQLDGAIASLDALPECVDAVGGKIPVLMDGGIRRGQDILKALALGAKGVLIGRAPLWGLAAFGQPGVERVLWMLGAELKLAMGLAGVRKLSEIDRRLVRKIPA